MGEVAEILLVVPRHLLLLGLILLAGCSRQPDGPVVDPRRHDAFFVWAGVTPPPEVARARTLYLLAGEVRHGDANRMVPLRAVPHVVAPEVWLTVRAERLDWGEGVYRQILLELPRWAEGGNHVVGLQVDFDAATRGLAGYRAFLVDLRRRLPRRYRLSVTGLLDWSAHGDPAALASLRGVTDEIVVQTYQGRRTIPGYAGYLAALARLDLPYRVGVVEGGEWREPAELRASPNYRGTVVFLLPLPRASGSATASPHYNSPPPI